jgi:hypothetical protein
VIDTTDKSVTFFDGPNVCRLLALRVSQLIEMPLEQIAFATKPLDETALGKAMVLAWTSGDVAYGTVPEKVAARLKFV